MNFCRLKYIIFILIVLASCKNTDIVQKGFQTIRIKNPPKGKPYIFENEINLVDKYRFTPNERLAIKSRLKNQLDDSTKVEKVDNLFFFGTIRNPIAFDSLYTSISAKNMQGSMYHLGYYEAQVEVKKTIKKKRIVTVIYNVTAGKPTIMDSIAYRLKIPDLQRITLGSLKESQIIKNTPVSKTAILAEVARLVDSFKNNGYYKFTASEIRVLGDSSIAALTTLSDDPFEQLRLLEESQKKRDSPTVKIAFALNKTNDSSKLTKYFINKIFVLSDYRPNDLLSDTIRTGTYTSNFFTERYHKPIFKTSLLTRYITLHKGDVFRQIEYLKTLNNLTKLGVWLSVNIRLIENLDYPDKVDIIIELIPAKKYSPSTSLESSLSNNALGRNLFGISLNVGLTNKNFAREAIRMTHNLKFGIELNFKKNTSANNIVTSNEVGYSNNMVIPRLLLFQNKFKTGESFINTSFSHNNRLNLFSLNAVSINAGIATTYKPNKKFNARLFTEYNYLYNESQVFIDTLNARPFLRYSYNTAFVGGLAFSITKTFNEKPGVNSESNERFFKINFEESWLMHFAFPKLKEYVKADIEYKYTNKRKNKIDWAFRAYAGIGWALGKDSALPFFKQFSAGGSNSMRGWPVRGIGLGSQPLAPRSASNFNDRTGDFQIELNGEFRHNIARLYKNFITLKGAIFADAGNIWNIKAPSSSASGLEDLSQLKAKNFYKELGLSAGYGFRLDFSYLIIRTDFSFRFKRPETSDINNGWKAPNIGFNDGFRKIFGSEFRDWRYENFNFTLGINYPF
jgi:outer membrane protein insertion porin family